MKDEHRKNIRHNLDKPDYKAYPIHIALMDVVEYHRSCSFMFGLQKALDEGTRTAPPRSNVDTHPSPIAIPAPDAISTPTPSQVPEQPEL